MTSETGNGCCGTRHIWTESTRAVSAVPPLSKQLAHRPKAHDFPTTLLPPRPTPATSPYELQRQSILHLKSTDGKAKSTPSWETLCSFCVCESVLAVATWSLDSNGTDLLPFDRSLFPLRDRSRPTLDERLSSEFTCARTGDTFIQSTVYALQDLFVSSPQSYLYWWSLEFTPGNICIASLSRFSVLPTYSFSPFPLSGTVHISIYDHLPTCFAFSFILVILSAA